jgi:hypothetical protein
MKNLLMTTIFIVLLSGCAADQPGIGEYYSYCQTEEGWRYAPQPGPMACPYQNRCDIPSYAPAYPGDCAP